MQTLLLVRAGENDLPEALRSEADAVVVDLPGDAFPEILRAVCDGLAPLRHDDVRPLVFVRLPPTVDESLVDEILAALLPAEPDGFVLARCGGGAEVQQLGARLAVHEARLDLADGQTGIIAEIGAVARAVLALDGFVRCSQRLMALAWNPHAFAAELGLDDVSSPGSPDATARGLVVVAARAAEVGAIEWDTGEQTGDTIERASRRARRDGFNGKATVFPALLASVRAGFTA